MCVDHERRSGTRERVRSAFSLEITIIQNVKDGSEWRLEQHVQHKRDTIDQHHKANVEEHLCV